MTMNLRNWMLATAMGVLLAGCAQTESDAVKANMAENTEMVEVTGTLAYRERIALPENAEVTVTLEDTSLADAKAVVLDTQTFITEGKQVPFSFSLSYNSADIDPRHTYNVRAQIRVDGKLRFTTDTAVRVITDIEQTHDVAIQLVGVR